ncbi:MAG: regulatory protein RecX [Pseudomonadota bacterium]
MSDPKSSSLSPNQCRKRAMDALARREHGFDELVDKLCDRGFEPEIVVAELSRLREEGLQSDKRFAEAFVSSRFRQGKGPQRIRAELRAKRLSDALVDEALRDGGFDWGALARDVRVRKYGEAVPETFELKAKQMRFLTYRGFSQEQISVAMS